MPKQKGPSEEVVTHLICEVCSSESDFNLIANELRYGEGRNVYRCSSCSLAFLHPKMTPEEERKFYEEEYGVILSNEKGCTPEELYEKQIPDAKMYLEWSKPYISASDTCLEIGCASGYFLDTIAPHVDSVCGLESHAQLSSFCESRGLAMMNSLEDCAENSFDVVFLFFVFEHIGDPRGFLDAVRRVTKPKGNIVMVVPNINDALFSLYDIPAFIPFYFTPAHHFYYSPETLTQLCDASGFKTEITTYQRYDLSNHFRWMQKGRPGGQEFYKSVFSKQLNDDYRASLQGAGHGDTIFAVLSNNILTNNSNQQYSN